MGLSKRVVGTYRVIERIIIYVLLAMLTLVVLNATFTIAAEVCRRLWLRISGAPADPASVSAFLQNFAVFREVFGAFLLVLIGLELIKTVITYLEGDELEVGVVFTVAMIAIARHAIDLDVEHLDPMRVIGMGGMILALALSYFYFRKADAGRRPKHDSR